MKELKQKNHEIIYIFTVNTKFFNYECSKISSRI